MSVVCEHDTVPHGLHHIVYLNRYVLPFLPISVLFVGPFLTALAHFTSVKKNMSASLVKLADFQGCGGLLDAVVCVSLPLGSL